MRRAPWVWAARLLARSSRYAAALVRQCPCSLLLLLLLLYRPAAPATAAARALHGDSVRDSGPTCLIPARLAAHHVCAHAANKAVADAARHTSLLLAQDVMPGPVIHTQTGGEEGCGGRQAQPGDRAAEQEQLVPSPHRRHLWRGQGVLGSRARGLESRGRGGGEQGQGWHSRRWFPAPACACRPCCLLGSPSTHASCLLAGQVCKQLEQPVLSLY